MKTKEQILKWLNEQPWKGEFYEETFINRLGAVDSYDEDFIIDAFCRFDTESGSTVWAKRNTDFRSWYDANDRPMSWEEYCAQNPIKEDEKFISAQCEILDVIERPRNAHHDVNVMSKDLCKAFLAYMKLIQLRNAWVEDYCDEDCFYKIVTKDNIIMDESFSYFMSGLSFPTHEMANEFMKTFEDLLEVAKPLL